MSFDTMLSRETEEILREYWVLYFIITKYITQVKYSKRKGHQYYLLITRMHR